MRIQACSMPIFHWQNINIQKQTIQTPRYQQNNNIDTVSFGTRIIDKYPKEFLKELVQFGLPCPICNKEMIALEFMNRPAKDSLMFLADKYENMSPIGQVMYKQLKFLSKKFPEKNIQELLQTQFKKAEVNLIVEQREILDELNFVSWQLPEKKGMELRKLIGKTFETIFKREPNPKKRFKRKKVIEDFDAFTNTLCDQKLKKKIGKAIRELPTSDNSINAFVVKYASRAPEEIAMKLHREDFATLEHIIPDSKGGRLVIWECSEDNAERGNSFILEQLQKHPEMPTNLQKHIDRLIEIHDVEFNLEPKSKRNLLKNYIFSLQNEFAMASSGVLKPDISALGPIPKYMIEEEIVRIKEMGRTDYLPNLYKMLRDKQ